MNHYRRPIADGSLNIGIKRHYVANCSGAPPHPCAWDVMVGFEAAAGDIDGVRGRKGLIKSLSGPDSKPGFSVSLVRLGAVVGCGHGFLPGWPAFRESDWPWPQAC